MLEDEEFAPISELLRQGIEAIQARREERGLSLAQVKKADCYGPALDAYERLTGHRESNPDELRHHVISLYGPPCSRCGRPLRTDRAVRCAECGHARGEA